MSAKSRIIGASATGTRVVRVTRPVRSIMRRGTWSQAGWYVIAVQLVGDRGALPCGPEAVRAQGAEAAVQLVRQRSALPRRQDAALVRDHARVAGEAVGRCACPGHAPQFAPSSRRHP
ncbi:hypothetical protein J2S47_002123 [Streptomyces griseoviridis]|uniref:Transposase n=1 Tax=Streptomyces griseoviridis TaxID=45398 RepID=A0ABT9LGM8_STRGD|nr:hypothetical protein [Streptomyces griseoviridis]